MPKDNFSDTEQELLLELVKPHSEIIYSKENSTAVNLKKKKVWDEIANTFNSSGKAKKVRQIDSLRRAIQNMTQVAKKELAAVKKSRLATGGGPAVAQPSELALKIAELNTGLFLPLDNPFDSDVNHHGDDVQVLDDCGQLDLNTQDNTESQLEPIANSQASATIGPLTPASSKVRPFVFSRKRKAETPSTKLANDYQSELLALRQEQHVAKMGLYAAKKLKLDWEAAYWKAKFETEFGQRPTYFTSANDGEPFYFNNNL